MAQSRQINLVSSLSLSVMVSRELPPDFTGFKDGLQGHWKRALYTVTIVTTLYILLTLVNKARLFDNMADNQDLFAQLYLDLVH